MLLATLFHKCLRLSDKTLCHGRLVEHGWNTAGRTAGVRAPVVGFTLMEAASRSLKAHPPGYALHFVGRSVSTLITCPRLGTEINQAAVLSSWRQLAQRALTVEASRRARASRPPSPPCEQGLLRRRGDAAADGQRREAPTRKAGRAARGAVSVAQLGSAWRLALAIGPG
eukprot:366238-Chlamydomonas_euryale.AAC.6